MNEIEAVTRALEEFHRSTIKWSDEEEAYVEGPTVRETATIAIAALDAFRAAAEPRPTSVTSVQRQPLSVLGSEHGSGPVGQSQRNPNAEAPMQSDRETTAAWKISEADLRRAHFEAPRGFPETIREGVEAAVALGIVPDPRQHGEGRCSSASPVVTLSADESRSLSLIVAAGLSACPGAMTCHLAEQAWGKITARVEPALTEENHA